MVRSILTSSLLFLLSNQAILNVAANQQEDNDESRLSMSNSNGTMAMSLVENHARDIFGLKARQGWVCDAGYASCPHDSSVCCRIGKKCCTTGYCADLGGTCCPGKGSCPLGWGCCGENNCYPKGGECCSDGKYCRPGWKCRVYKGEKKCCRIAGCAGEDDRDDNNDDGDDSDDNVPIPTNARTTTSASTTTTSTTRIQYDYYTTVITWYFYVWFYTPAPALSTTTVTSTRETTSTTWSIYDSNSASAMSSLAERSSTYSFPTPAMATIFKPESTDSIPRPTANAPPEDEDQGGSGNLNAPGAASSITSPSGSTFWWITICLGSLLPFFLFTVFA